MNEVYQNISVAFKVPPKEKKKIENSFCKDIKCFFFFSNNLFFDLLLTKGLLI